MNFFRSKQTVILRSQKEMEVLQSLLAENIPDALLSKIRQGKIAVMGGAILDIFLGKPVKDIDIFTWTPSEREACSLILKDAGYQEEKLGNIFSTWKNQNDTSKKNIDLVFVGDSFEDCLSSVDFTVRKIGFTAGKFHCDKNFSHDVAERVLTYTGKSFDLYKTALSTIKYQAKGFTISDSELHKIFVDLGYRIDLSDSRYQ